MSGYAVLDVETTGLSLTTDRVVEMGLVLLDLAGKPSGEFVTLIDPGRDIGPTGVHGIRAADVVGAPRFGDIAEHLFAALDGRVLVSHNAWFDLRFLAEEFRRCGLSLGSRPYVCTMQRCAQLYGARSLSSCCDALGVTNWQPHSALGDAHATAEILRLSLEDGEKVGLAGAGWVTSSGAEAGFRPVPDRIATWTALFEAAGATSALLDGWEYLAQSRDEAVRKRKAPARYLAELVSQLPAIGASPQLHNYLALLDEALEDRLLTESEAEHLAAAARELGCSTSQVAHAHRLYLDALVGVALSDGVVTESEDQDLHDVADLLGLSEDDLLASTSLAGAGATINLPTHGRITLPAGAVVVFTGAMSMERDALEAIARDAGLTPAPNVTKRTTLVVAADASSQSGKARLARDKGIRIVTEPVFHQLVSDRGAHPERTLQLASR